MVCLSLSSPNVVEHVEVHHTCIDKIGGHEEDHLSLLCAPGQPSKFIDNYIYYGDEMFHNLLILTFDPKNTLDGYTSTSCEPHLPCSTQNSISPMMNSIPPMMN